MKGHVQNGARVMVSIGSFEGEAGIRRRSATVAELAFISTGTSAEGREGTVDGHKVRVLTAVRSQTVDKMMIVTVELI